MFQNRPRNSVELDRLPVIDQNLARVYNLRLEKCESPRTRMANSVQSEQSMQTIESSSLADTGLCFCCRKPKQIEKFFFSASNESASCYVQNMTRVAVPESC